MVEDPKRPGKLRKVKKQIPSYIPEHDAMILAKVRKSAYRLDMSLFNLFGIRFGWESVIGFVPMAGDVVGSSLAYLLVRECDKIEGGLPSSVRNRMMLNIGLDFAVGLVPLVGDILDGVIKCNTMNLKLFEEYLDQKYNPARGDERNLVGVDKEKRRKNRQSGIFHPADPPPATVFEDFSDEEDERRQFVREQDAAAARVQQPRAARAPEERRGGGGGGGWFSGGRNGGSRRDRDLDMQETGSVRR